MRSFQKKTFFKKNKGSTEKKLSIKKVESIVKSITDPKESR